MRRKITIGSAMFVISAALLYQVGCGSSPSAPSAPPPSGGGGNPSVIAIVGSSGSQAFTPNPDSVSNGGTFDFRNSDSNTHHIVADNGSFDTGTLPPGATSGVYAAGSGAIQYHCTIHPSMVGSINGSANSGPTGPGY